MGYQTLSMPCRAMHQSIIDRPHLQSTSILEDLLAVGLSLVRGRLCTYVSTVPLPSLHKSITHLIAQSSLVTTKYTAVLA